MNFLQKEIKDVLYIEKEIKGNWLDVLNRTLTATQGKAHPKDILTEEVMTSSLKKDIEKSKQKKKYVSEKFTPLFFESWHIETYQYWVWNISKRIRVIPESIRKSLKEEIDISVVPSAPLFQCPEWVTMVKLEGVEIKKEIEDQHQHCVLFSSIIKRGKEYLYVRVPITVKNNEGNLVFASFFFFISKESSTIKEGHDIATNELQDIIDDYVKSGQCFVSLDDKQALKDCLNIILFVNGEYTKKNIDKKTGKTITQDAPKGGYKVRVTGKIDEIIVGEEYVIAQNSYLSSGVGISRKSHFRKGHFRTYWLGPRALPQTPVVHWIPPMIVAGKVSE